MRIAALRITNFRSFGPTCQTFTFDNRLNCFIGLNSGGKTTALHAICKLFGDRIERNLFAEDFHRPGDEDPLQPTSKFLTIEADLVFDENDSAFALFEGQYTIDSQGGVPFVRIRQEATWEPSATSPEGEIDQKQYFITLPSNGEDGEEKKEFRRSMYALFQVIYIPALRKTADQLRFASGSIFHRLLKTVNYTSEFRDDVREQVEGLNELFTDLPDFNTIQRTLQDNWSKFHRDPRFRDANMKFGTGEIDEILKKLEIHFTPAIGHYRDSNIDDLGDGYRSLFYITMVCALLQVEQTNQVEELDGDVTRPVVTLLLVEEPENHIAPQILGRVIRVLQDISSTTGLGVFLSSHTSAVVKRLDPESIYHFRINKKGETEVRDIELPEREDEAYKYVKEAIRNYPEIYFAKVVVIGEGDTEDVIFNHITKIRDFNFDENLVTFVPLGHRFVNHIWKLLVRLEIPYVTLLDLDLGRHLGGWGRIKYALKELISLGKDPNEVLRLNRGRLSDDELEDMHERNYGETQLRNMSLWLRRLECYDVFYSRDLDLDFCMLKKYSQYYKSKDLFPAGGGPRIPRLPANREAYIEKAVAATLKNENYIQGLYNDEDRELMIWYNYHFLGRGKPSTHIQALTLIPDDVFEENLPDVFSSIFGRIGEKLQ